MNAHNVKVSEKYRSIGESRYVKAVKKSIFFNKRVKKMKIWRSEERIDTLPDFYEKMPEENWNYWEGMNFDFGCLCYPYFVRDFPGSPNIDWDIEIMDSNLCPDRGNFTLYNYIKTCQKGTQHSNQKYVPKTLRSFRIELDDPKWIELDDNYCAIDGDCFLAKKMQGGMIQEKMTQTA